MDDKIHLYGNSDEWARCGMPVNNVGITNITNNVEHCTCRKCAVFMLRDVMNRFMLLEER